MVSKKLLKLKEATSDLEEFDEGLRFKKVIVDQNKEQVSADKVRKILFCSGQVYYDLEHARKKEGKNDIQIIRVEQLSPYPFKEIIEQVQKFKNADVMWVQEEPKNYGAWTWCMPRLQNILKHCGRKPEVKYAGRDPSASSSTGFGKVHENELKAFLKEALA